MALGDYYSNVGSIFGQAAGGMLGGAVTSTISNVDNQMYVTTTDVAGGLYNYVYNPQQLNSQDWYSLGVQGLQVAQQSIQKPIEKAKNILESLRNEIHNWCANALEVA